MENSKELQFTGINKGQFVSKDLKFSEIVHGNFTNETASRITNQRDRIRNNSIKINKARVTGKTSSEAEKVSKKRSGAITTISILLASYLVFAGIVATNKVNNFYEPPYSASGSNLVTDSSNVPDGAYWDEFVNMLNPIELVQEVSNQIKK